MTQIATTVEQSKKLLELGLSPDTADMYYPKVYKDTYSICPYPNECNVFREQKLDIPAWSLTALLKLMPKNKDYNMCWDLSFGSYDNNDDFISKYHCDFIDSSEDSNNPIIKFFNEDTPLKAVYNMIEWLLENGYIKIEKQ